MDTIGDKKINLNLVEFFKNYPKGYIPSTGFLVYKYINNFIESENIFLLGFNFKNCKNDKCHNYKYEYEFCKNNKINILN